ncbi:ATP-binding protein [Streptomyces roseolus]|uniref:ATP-binding protein n=1 Tax=Streptomyces roseolus TaxID=67358 RepID=UPI0037B47D24
MEAQERNRGTSPGRSSRRYALDGGPGTAGFLRRLSAQAVADWYGPLSASARTAVADVQLLVTELVLDAVRRGGVPYEFRLDRSADGVLLQVSDTWSPAPCPEGRHRPGAPGRTTLHLVRRLAATWGWTVRDHGRTVWCEVRVPQVPAAPRHLSEAAPGG